MSNSLKIIVFLVLLPLLGATQEWKIPISKNAFFLSSLKEEPIGPILYGDKVIAISARGWLLVATRDGRILLRTKLTGSSKPVSRLVFEDKIIVGFDNGLLKCFELEDGKKLWEFNAQSSLLSSPAVSHKTGVVIFQTARNEVIAIDAMTGGFKWSYQHIKEPGLQIKGLCPALVLDDLVYIGFAGGYVACLTIENGKEIWKKLVFEEGPLNDIVAPLGFDEELIYATSFNNITAGISKKTGKVFWKAETGGICGPYVEPENIYVAGMELNLVQLNKITGLPNWQLNLLNEKKKKFKLSFSKVNLSSLKPNQQREGNWINWIASYDDDTLILTTREGKLYFVSKTTGKLTKTLSLSSKLSSEPGFDPETKELFIINSKGYLLKRRIEK